MAKPSSDTRKQVWKFQEGAIVLAAQQIIGDTAKVHWDHTPQGMSIDPDVVIGADPDSPEILVFVTHASAERAGEKKFWRTVAEAIEAKRLSSHPKIISVLYTGNVKAALKVIYKTLFDASLHLDETSYGIELDNVFAELTDKHGRKNKDDCFAILESEVAAGAVPEFLKLKRDLKVMLGAKLGPKHALMASPIFAGKARLPSKARQTSLRRSVCKLYSLPADVRNSLMTGSRIASLPPHGLLLGWFTEGMAGDIELVDSELREFLTSVSRADVEFLCETVDKTLPSFRQYAETLRAIGESKYCNEWILGHFGELKTQLGMTKALDAIFTDPTRPLTDLAGRPVELKNHWLFQTLMAMLRIETGRADGYGYAGLSKDTGIVSGINGGYISVADFASRKERLNPTLLNPIAKIFARHIARLGYSGASDLLNKGVLTQAEAIFNFQMMNYRNYNPIDWLVSRGLQKARIGHTLSAHHSSFLSTLNGGVASRTGNLIMLDGGHVWIKCQSAYDGRIDKRKELCGRVGAIKLCYSTKELAEKRFYLVIDGSFDDDDLKLFGKAGWDGVFYYDELGELLKVLQ